MKIDDKIMIEFADWVFEVLNSGVDVTNTSSQNKLAELMLKYEDEIDDEDGDWEEDDDYNEDIGRGSPSLSKLILSEIELR